MKLVLLRSYLGNDIGKVIDCSDEDAKALLKQGIAAQAKDEDLEEEVEEDEEVNEEIDKSAEKIAKKLDADLAMKKKAMVESAVSEVVKEALKQITKEGKAPFTLAAEAKDKNYGWKSTIDFHTAVVKAARGDTEATKKLTYSDAQIKADFYNTVTAGEGGNILPPTFSTNILGRAKLANNFRTLCQQHYSQTNTYIMPLVNESDITTSFYGGMTYEWVSEGSAIDKSMGAFEQISVPINRVGVFSQASEQMLKYNPVGFAAWLDDKVGDVLGIAVDRAILHGAAGGLTGVLEDGVAHSSVVTVAKETSQAANTINLKNIQKMDKVMMGTNAIWVFPHSARQQLLDLRFPDASGSFPAYLGAGQGNYASAAYGVKDGGILYGRPVMFSHACKSVGTIGDVFLIDFSQYGIVNPIGGEGMTAEQTIYVDFNKFLRSFRYSIEVGGAPTWKTTMTSLDQVAYTWCAVLATRGT